MAAGRPDTGLVSVNSNVRVQVGPKAVGSFLPKLTQKAFERYGFPAAALLTDWQAIAGRELASFTRPERLKWPRRPDGNNVDLAGADVPVNAPDGATMVLRVEGGRAIEIQMRSEQLLERINAYFGFRAVTSLRFVQAPLAVRPQRRIPAASSPPRAVVDAKAGGAARLSSALERLGRAVETRAKSKLAASRS